MALVETVANMSSDDIHLVPSSSQIPLASHYGQVFLATLYCLPMSSKINLLKIQANENYQESPTKVTFLLPGGASLTIPELVMITASYEIADEIYSCSGSVERMRKLAESIERDSGAFAASGRTILSGLELIKKEVKKRKKKISNAQVSLAVRELDRHVNNIDRTLRRAGIRHNDLELLVPLKSLLSNNHAHHTHQHWAKDERWNLLGD